MAVLAQSFNVPFYVVAESYKFVRAFPLSSSDMPSSSSASLLPRALSANGIQSSPSTPSLHIPANNEDGAKKPMMRRLSHSHLLKRVDATEGMTSEQASLVITKHATIDYTPPTYITLLFTDIGLMTPSSVSDELIKLYY